MSEKNTTNVLFEPSAVAAVKPQKLDDSKKKKMNKQDKKLLKKRLQQEREL